LTTQAKASVINYDRNSSIIVLATVITIVNYDHNSFIIQSTVITIVNYDRNGFIIQSTGG
jgi:hypothetical protein